jgi:hypothetical protein
VEPDGARPVMAGAGWLTGFLDAITVVAGAFDRAGAGPFTAWRVERCALVKPFLKSGVLTELGNREETLTGTPQGGILSPSLANIALSALDDHFDRQWHHEMGNANQRAKRRRKGQGIWRIIRYCDDFVLVVFGDRLFVVMMSAARSAIARTVALVFAAGRVGITDASTTRSPSIPCTCSLRSVTAVASVPIRQVPTGWK